jgi:hypothetical protein
MMIYLRVSELSTKGRGSRRLVIRTELDGGESLSLPIRSFLLASPYRVCVRTVLPLCGSMIFSHITAGLLPTPNKEGKCGPRDVEATSQFRTEPSQRMSDVERIVKGH